jgi:hypothetical protein
LGLWPLVLGLRMKRPKAKDPRPKTKKAID